MKAMLLPLVSAATLQYSSESSIESVTADGKLKLTYSTYIDGAPGLFYGILKGKWELQDTIANVNAIRQEGKWEPQYHYRICMEWGSEGTYMENREQIRWVRYGDRSEWEPFAETAIFFDPAEASKFYKFCTEDGTSSNTATDRIDSGVII